MARQVEEQVEAWTAELGWWLDRVSPVFARPEPRVLLGQMTVGLLSPLRKKNGWTLAEQAGHTHPGRIQTFLCRGAWDGAVLEARVRELVVESLGDAEDGVLIVDDTALVKKGSQCRDRDWLPYDGPTVMPRGFRVWVGCAGGAADGAAFLTDRGR